MAIRATKSKTAGVKSPSDRHRLCIAWFHQELRRQAANRFQMALDEDYYDSDQWRPEDAQESIRRGQYPVSWNEVKPTIDWLIGTERRTRMDYKVIPRNEQSDEADADGKAKTNLLKYLDDVNRGGFERSQAFDDCIKAGLGWIEVGVRGDPEDEPIYKRSESWRNMLYDSLDPRRDLDQSRYLFRYKFVDLDVAQAYFPGKTDALERAAMGSDSSDHYMNWFYGRRVEDYDTGAPMLEARWTYFDSSAWLANPRRRVMLIECWYREPFTKSTGEGAGITDRTFMRMRCAVMTEQEMIIDAWSPYRHNKFPFIPVWCYRRKRDNAPYGAVRAQRGPQDVINKTMSKAVWTASANQIIAEKDAFDPKEMTVDEIRDEMSAPDGLAILAVGGLSKFKKIESQALTDGFVRLASHGVESIRTGSGVTGENRGLETDAKSGKAIGLKQEQGGVVTAEIFDNTLLARQMEGEIELSLCEQYITEPLTFPVPGERGRHEYHSVNQVDPMTGRVSNDITARAGRFIIGEQAWRQSLMQASFESMMDLMGKIAAFAPQAVTAMLVGVLELADIPNKQSMLKQVREALGQPDPDSKPTPEEQQAQAMRQSQQEQTAQAQLDLLLAKVAEAKARGEKLSADSLLAMMTSFFQALQAAQIVATVPGVAPPADAILQGGGFKPVPGGQDPNLPAPATLQPPAPALPGPTLLAGHLQGIQTGRGSDNIRRGGNGIAGI